MQKKKRWKDGERQERRRDRAWDELSAATAEAKRVRAGWGGRN